MQKPTHSWVSMALVTLIITNAYSGGAIYTSGNVVLTFIGTNNFIDKSANSEGGAIHANQHIG